MFKTEFISLFTKKPNANLILDSINNKEIKSKEFFNNAIKIANFLIEKENLRRGDKLILKIEHSIIFYELIIACAIAGVVACPVNQNINSLRLKQIKDIIKPKLIINSVKEIFYSTNSETPKNFEKFNFNQEYLIIFSSGTTSGIPKGIIHSIGNIIKSAKSFSKIGKFSSADKFHAFWPQHHMTGIFNLFFVPLVTSAKIVFTDEFKVFLLKKLMHETKKHQITKLYLSPTMCAMAINFKKELLPNFKFLKKTHIISTASILYPSTFKQFYEIFRKKIIKCYGLTELGGSLTIDLNPNIKGDFSVGKYSSDVKIKCKGNKKNPLKIFIQSKFEMSGCLNFKFRKKNYYDTGDIGYILKKKLFVLGRVGDNIKKNGEFISMSEIENLVLEVEGVKNAMVIPFKDETFGFKIKLFIEINSDKNNEDLKNKMQLVFNTNLTKNEEPDEIIFKKNIKKTSTGKNIKYLYR